MSQNRIRHDYGALQVAPGSPLPLKSPPTPPLQHLWQFSEWKPHICQGWTIMLNSRFGANRSVAKITPPTQVRGRYQNISNNHSEVFQNGLKRTLSLEQSSPPKKHILLENVRIHDTEAEYSLAQYFLDKAWAVLVEEAHLFLKGVARSI